MASWNGSSGIGTMHLERNVALRTPSHLKHLNCNSVTLGKSDFERLSLHILQQRKYGREERVVGGNVKRHRPYNVTAYDLFPSVILSLLEDIMPHIQWGKSQQNGGQVDQLFSKLVMGLSYMIYSGCPFCRDKGTPTVSSLLVKPGFENSNNLTVRLSDNWQLFEKLKTIRFFQRTIAEQLLAK